MREIITNILNLDIYVHLEFFSSKYHLVKNLFHTTTIARRGITTKHNKLGCDNYYLFCEIVI